MISALSVGSFIGVCTSNWRLIAQAQTAAEYSEDELRQIQLAERFLGILQKNPRRGTALDRVYGHHIEFGTLESFVEKLKQQTQDAPDDGSLWMLRGLFESQRGEDAEAAQAFTRAEGLRPEDAMTPYYLSQSLLRIGENQKAVEAMERAIACNPPRVDLLEIFQQLGRIHQRAQRTEEALAVWQRLETLFPNDPRVLEQIAITLAEEGQPELALPRYQKLAAAERDDYRKTMYRVAAAELKIKTQIRADGIADFEAILSDLNPEGWLFRDVRRRIEDVFLRSSDQDSLVKYYEGWIADHPEDVEAMSRLARFLSGSARVTEATEWMEKALKLAPSRSDLRKAFIDQLVEQQRFTEAAQQYDALCQAEPSNIDFLRDWGKLVLSDRSLDLQDRQTEAVRIWNLMLADRSSDALVTAQVADLCRGADLKERAFELYQKAVELAPGEPQYREYLGEFYHIEKQPERALETWAGIAAPPNRNAGNLARVGEVYNSFGYLAQAVESIVAAVDLEPKEFPLQIRAAVYHSRSEKFDEALAYIDAAEPLTTNDDQRATVVTQRIDVLQSSNRLEAEIESLQSRLANLSQPQVDDWQLLARYLEARRNWPAANEAIDSALKIDANSVPALTTAARISEASGDLGRAADINRRLAEADRRSRGDHIMNVARLEAQLGRADEAMEAANQLIIAAPGNTDNYEFFAQLCFRLGKRTEGLDALRKAIRINPNEPRLTMALGAALAEDLQTREAIELYWRAFDKTDEVEDRTSLVVKLVPLYEQLNQFDQFVERLERDRRDEDKRREMTICLAQAYQTANDFGTARYELESLLSESTRDTNLLQQLAKLCQASGDMESAINYQRQLVNIAPGHETEYPLASMLQAYGFREEANEILVRLTRREEDPIRLLRSLDSLLARDGQEAVLKIVEPLVSQQRDDWELLYREAVAWAQLEKFEEASTRFNRILSLNLPYDSLGRSAEEKLKRAQQKARSENLRGMTTNMPTRQAPLQAVQYAYQIQEATGLTVRNYYGGSTANNFWAPESYAMARMAAYGWLLNFEQSNQQRNVIEGAQNTEQTVGSLAQQLAAKIAQENPPLETVNDYLFVSSLSNDSGGVFRAAKTIAESGGKDEWSFFLTQLPTRNQNRNTVYSAGTPPKAEPLSDENLALMMKLYERLLAAEEEKQGQVPAGNQVVYASNGQAYVMVGGRYVAFGSSSVGSFYTQIVINELRLAGRNEQADELFEAELVAAEGAAELARSFSALLEQKEFDRVEEYFQKWLTTANKELEEAPEAPAGRSARNALAIRNVTNGIQLSVCRWLGRLGPEEEYDRILKNADAMLDIGIKEIQVNADAYKLASRRAGRQNSTAQAAMRNVAQVQVFYGEKQENERIQMIAPEQLVSYGLRTTLYQLLKIYREGDMVDQLVEHLRIRVANAGAETVATEKAMLASMLWWTAGQDEALELLSEVGTGDDDSSFKLTLAELHITRNAFDVALEIIDTIPVSDQALLRQRELVALRVAERLGDVDRARQAAESLFGMRLDAPTQLQLVGPMRRLGLTKLADAVLARAERSTGNQPAALASLMTLYRGQSKTEDAKKLAFTLLRRTVSPITTLAASQQTARYRSTNTAESNSRSQALRLLQETGELETMITEQEKRIERYPDVMRSYELMVEYCEAAGKRERALEVLQEIVQRRPKAYAMRMKLAEVYQSQGKTVEASDQYLQILKEQPSWILNDYYRYSSIFRQANRTKELAEILSSLNFRQIQQPYQIINAISELINNDSDSEAAISLLERALEEMPTYRSQLLRNIGRNSDFKKARIFNLVLKNIVPTKLQAEADPWAGVNEISSYSSGGEVNTQFEQLVSGVKGTEKLAELESVIRRGLEETPQWTAGKLMLAIIGMNSEDAEQQAGKQALIDLASDEDTLESMPYATCWFLGQELDQLPEQRGLAVKVLERAMAKDNRNSINQIQYSPVAKLIASYASAGRKEDAKDLLMKQMAAVNYDQFDASYATSQKVEQSMWCAQKLTELGFLANAIRMYQDVLSDRPNLHLAGQRRSSDGSYYLKQAEQGLDKILGDLNDDNYREIVENLFTLDGQKKDSASTFQLSLNFPEAEKVGSEPISSSMIDLVLKLCKEQDSATALDEKLDLLRREKPDDISIIVLSTITKLQIASQTAAELLDQLVQWSNDHPLEPIAENRRPNSRQRRESEGDIALWLVARSAADASQWSPHGPTLARRAVDAAKRQLDKKQSTALLFEWAKLAAEDSDGSSKALWDELLVDALNRPDSPTTTTKDGTSVERIAPLTTSQFDLAMRVAEESAILGFVDLSQEAIRQSLAGGLPVPDAEPVDNDPFGRSSVTITRINNRQVNSRESSESKVAIAVNRVVSKWQGEKYDDKQVFETLASFVFPEGSNDEIRLYADSTALTDRRATSLARILVQRARNLDKLDWVDEQATARGTQNRSNISSLVLRILVAIERGNTEQTRELLESLSSVLKAGVTQPDAELACHAIIPAGDYDELIDNAMPVLTQAVQVLEQQSSAAPNTNDLLSVGRLKRWVNEYYASKGSNDLLRKSFEDRLFVVQGNAARYSGDYGIYQQLIETARLANEAGTIKSPELAMDFLGRTVDLQVDRYSRPSLDAAMISAVGMTRKLDDDASYNIWATWTLPNDDRRTLRVAIEWINAPQVPDVFTEVPKGQQPISKSEMLSNLKELVDAASASGKLDELRVRVEKAVEDQLVGAEHLMALVLIAQADDATARDEANDYLSAFFKRRQPSDEKSSQQKQLLSMADHLVFLNCLDANVYFDKSLDRFSEFDRRLKSGSATQFRGLFRQKLLEKASQKDLNSGIEPLVNWISQRDAVPGSNDKATWMGDAASATHAGGSGSEMLTFAYPLTGEFEFEIDCYNGDWGECDLGYGGVIINAQRWGSQMTIAAIGNHETISRPQSLKTDQPSYGRFRILSDGEMMSVFLNGYKAYEEKLSTTSPWLVLATEGTRSSRFMNPRISGQPVIPDAVPLFAGNRMDGWSTQAFSQSQPRHRVMSEKVEEENSSLAYSQRNEPTSFDWETKDGVLHGSREDALSEGQRWIYYQRPLREGDSFTYEFFYQPGVTTVAPTIGQLAMLIEPDAVHSHWISHNVLDQQIAGVEWNNKITEPECQVGDKILLKEQDWNAVTMQLKDGNVQLSLNGEKVFQRTLDEVKDRRFGLFHYETTDVKIRSAMLSGDWPDSIDDVVADGWFQWNDSLPQSQQAIVEAMLPRELEQPLLRQIVAKSIAMSDDDAIQYLSAWVLPSSVEGRVRMGFAYLPLTPQLELEPTNVGLDRVVSPALELVRRATASGKLDELIEDINQLQPITGVDSRNQQALRLLVMMQTADAECRQALGDLYASIKQPLPKHLTKMERAAEYLVAVEAGRKAEFWTAGYDILQRLGQHEHNGKTSSGNSDWRDAVNVALGAIALRWSGDTLPSTSHWTSIPYWKPQWQVAGEINSAWLVERGAISHIPGDHWSQLFFQSPLRGNYEITARRSTHGRKEVAIATGMHAADPRYDLKAIRVTTLMHSQNIREGEIKLPAWDQSADFRIIADDAAVTTQVNGVEIHRQEFPNPRDPWLVLQADAANSFASVRDLRITGNPIIPDEIDLIDIDTWASWRFDVYGDWSSQKEQLEVPYNRVNDEIRGNLRTDRSASPRESLMMYARPMLEDGEIEFETFYKEGEFEVHPAVGQTAFMLDEDRVALHQLTYAQWDESGLAKNNRAEISGESAKLELKEDQWNHVRLELTGDLVILFVNGDEVAQHTMMTSQNERFFGLFRYSDLTRCRVRNLKYRGDWPKSLPDIDQQESAYPNSGPYAFETSQEGELNAYDLLQPVADLTTAGLSLLGAKEQVTTTDGGLMLNLRNGAAWARWPGVARPEPIEGDCEITVRYQDLDVTNANSGWGNGLFLQVGLDDPQQTTIEVSVLKNTDGQAKSRGSIRRKMPDGQFSMLDQDTITGHNASGRLRLVRHGGRMHCLVAEGNSETFRLVHSLTVGPAKIRTFSVQAKCSDEEGTVSAVISDLTVKKR